MEATFRVKRYDPEKEGDKSWEQDYKVDITPTTTVLDALMKVREEHDGTLALRCSCRASICGSCGMRVNNKARLVCKTRVSEVANGNDVIEVEPLGNHEVVRDLVVNLDDFFVPLERIKPYLDGAQKPEKGEYIASNDSMSNLLTAMNCIMCGCCVSDCTVLEVDKKFLGPAILAKSWRFVEDPRDDSRSERLKVLNDEDGGMWDCTRCMQCVEVCPKDVAPMDRIMELREAAIADGIRNTPGYRHTESFSRSVKRYGRLDEARLAVESAGYTNFKRLFELSFFALKAMLRRKLPPLIPHKARNPGAIKSIFKKLERTKR